MSRAIALRLSMVMLVVAAGTVLAAPWSGADTSGVAVQDSSFTPKSLQIAPHDAVIFVRMRDSQLAHSITSDDGDFPEQEFGDRRMIGFRFDAPGTYAYHCKYHGQAGGRGMSGVILVGQPGEPPPTTTTTDPPPSSTSSSTSSSTTTTTRRPTTTTTRPPTTTTTRPPTTTTTEPPPPPTTTTQPPPIIPPPPVPPAPSPATTDPNPPTSSVETKRGGDRVSTTTTSGQGKAVAAADADPSTTTSTPPPEQPVEPAPPAEEAAIPVVESPASPSTEPQNTVQTLDDLALGRLAAEEETPPRRDRTGFIVGAGIALGVFLLVAAAWAWYHRSSRYLPA